jgi:hypothetical protein
MSPPTAEMVTEEPSSIAFVVATLADATSPPKFTDSCPWAYVGSMGELRAAGGVTNRYFTDSGRCRRFGSRHSLNAGWRVILCRATACNRFSAATAQKGRQERVGRANPGSLGALCHGLFAAGSSPRRWPRSNPSGHFEKYHGKYHATVAMIVPPATDNSATST